MTLVVIAGFLGLLLIQQRRNMRSDEDTLYISFISLVNVYMWTVAYLYSPANTVTLPRGTPLSKAPEIR